jgi:hypothetical protein
VPQRHSDDLYRFSYGIFKIEYVIIKLVLLGLSLFGLYKLVQDETGFTFASPPSIGFSAPVDPHPSPAAPATPQGSPPTPGVVYTEQRRYPIHPAENTPPCLRYRGKLPLD